MNGCYDFLMAPLEKRWLFAARSRLMGHAYGHVLEIGFGTGANLMHYRPDRITDLTAVDTQLPESAPEHPHFKTRYLKGSAEALPFPESSFDTVVETLVLCSVSDLEASLTEIYRVMKPGGLLIFIDHVLPEGRMAAAVFNALNRLWPHVAHGCNLNRSPHLRIADHGFTLLQRGSFARRVFRYGIAQKPLTDAGSAGTPLQL